MGKLSQKLSIYLTPSTFFSHNSYSFEDNLVNGVKTPYFYTMVDFLTLEVLFR